MGEVKIDDPRLPQRFWSKVSPEPNSGCWLWTASDKNGGYGSYWFGGRNAMSHRVAYESLVKKVPREMVIDHLCRVRCCVNPAHLEPVTNRVNLLRGESPSAHNARKTHCKHGHEFSEENTYSCPRGWRGCIKCRKATDQIVYRRRAERLRGEHLAMKEKS